MRYRLPRAVRDLTALDLQAKLSSYKWRNLASPDFRVAIGYLGLALRRDVKQAQIEAATYRKECQKLQHDMRYARSINADLGIRNCRLAERNDFLEIRNRELEGRNDELEQRNPHLEAENARLKKQNHWLYYGTQRKGPTTQPLLERLASSRGASVPS